MTTLVLDEIQGGFQSAQAVNENYRKIEVAVNDSLSRSGDGPNVMSADLDMGGKNIYNWGNPIVATAFNWRGPWAPFTEYKIGDVVELDSISYIAIVDGISGSTFNLNRWQLLAGASYPNVTSLRWKGEWTPDTDYIVGDVVKHADANWVCLIVHFSTDTFDGTKFEEMAAGDPLPDHAAGDGDVLITSGSTIKWGKVTAGNITTGTLSAITTNTGTLQVDTGGWIGAGTSQYNTGDGAWIGMHNSIYKMSIGKSGGHKFVFDGTSITFSGVMNAGSININNRFTVDAAGAVNISSAATGARLEIKNNVIKVFDASGVLRVKLGDLLA